MTNQTAGSHQKPTSLFNKNFSLLWLGQSISFIGKQMFYISMLFWIKHATESATVVGLLEMLSSLPALILGPLGGVAADRFSRRAILIISDFFLGGVVLLLSLGVFSFSSNTNLVIVFLFITAILISTVDAFFSPSITASIPDLVPESKIATANSLSQMSFQIALFVGQGIGGTLFRILGAPVLFLVNAIAYLVAGLSETFITIPQTIPEKSIELKQQIDAIKIDLVEGLRYVWQQDGLKRLVLLSAVINFFTVPIIILLPFYVEDTLKVTVDWYGFLIMAYGVGTMVGYGLTGAIGIKGKTRKNLFLAAIIIQSIGFALLGITRSTYVAMGMTFLGGMLGAFVAITITTILQILVPSEIRGRVFGLLGTLAGSISPISMGLTGVIADLLDQNIPLIYISCGVILSLVLLGLVFNKDMHSFLTVDQDIPLDSESQTAKDLTVQSV